MRHTSSAMVKKKSSAVLYHNNQSAHTWCHQKLSPVFPRDHLASCVCIAVECLISELLFVNSSLLSLHTALCTVRICTSVKHTF
jgi:hypothetical protein